jgi:zinc protease
MGLDGSFLSANWRDGIKLFAELLTAPAFSPEDFARKKEEQLTYLKNLDENLTSRVFRLARRELYRQHPYSVEYYGTYESVSTLTPEDAAGVYRDLVRPESLVFAVAGDVTPQEAAAALDEALAGWEPAGGKAPPSAPPAPPALPGPVMASEALDRNQAHIALSFLAPGLGSRDEAALQVLNSALSGMGGILFMELRDKKSLAYSVSSSYSMGLGTGSFNFYIGCAPDKASEALSGIIDIIRGARGSAYAADVVEGAKAFLAGTNKIEHQTLGTRVSDSALFDLYGQGQGRNEEFLAEVAAVTPEDVMRVAGEYLRLDQSVLAVIGTEDSIRAAEGLFEELKR